MIRHQEPHRRSREDRSCRSSSEHRNSPAGFQGLFGHCRDRTSSYGHNPQAGSATARSLSPPESELSQAQIHTPDGGDHCITWYSPQHHPLPTGQEFLMFGVEVG